jgi:hypothetical protein
MDQHPQTATGTVVNAAKAVVAMAWDSKKRLDNSER